MTVAMLDCESAAAAGIWGGALQGKRKNMGSGRVYPGRAAPSNLALVKGCR